MKVITNEQKVSFEEEFENEIKAIENKWINVVSQHSKPLSLVILAEAPKSFEKYFYNKMYNFLSGLKSSLELNNKDLREVMIEKGILLLDIYKLPIPSEFYEADTMNCLFDLDYYKSKLECIKELIGDNTKFVFRYKRLITKFQDNCDFKRIMTNYNAKLLISSSNIVSLYESEIPQKINPVVIPYLLQIEE